MLEFTEQAWEAIKMGTAMALQLIGLGLIAGMVTWLINL